MSDCSSPVKRTLESMFAHAFTLNTNPAYLLPSNVRSPKKKKHWNFLNYEALIDQQFLTEIEHLIARLQGNKKSDCCGWSEYLHVFSHL